MAFWNKGSEKTNKEGAPSKQADLGRNDPCHCGSGKKYKKCCIDKDQAKEHKALEESWAKSAAAKEQEEKKAAKDAKESSVAPTKHGGPAQSTQTKHQKFVPTQTSLPRKSGGG